jgi:soluble lytic murein transglycosylase-like protein
MSRVQSIIIPAALMGCLFVFWVATSATANLPAALTGTEAMQAAAQAPDTDNIQINTLDAPAPVQRVAACSLSARFPDGIRQWCNLVEQNAAQNNLPAALVAAVMWQESGGDPQAYSHSGAVGLLQVMPRDGLAAAFICQNGPCFASRPTITELQDPEFNLAYGTRMLAGLQNKYGNWRDALKFYGPIDVGYSYADKILSIWERYR